jgi:hypothetical protein
VQYKHLAFLAAIALLVLLAGCQIGTIGVTPHRDASPTPETEGPRAIVKSTTTAVPIETPSPAADSSPGVTPSETPLADRSECGEITGTDYRSPQEREWYLGNCLATPAPTVPPPQPPAIPGPEVQGERWILVDIGSQTATAMIGDQPLYTALVTTGVDGWDTPVGTWHILYRVENETMTSASIGADEYYVLDNVLYTQYFTNVGHALHLNYWRSDDYFGHIRSSHGCVGMRLADAKFFWDFATVGTRVTIQ